MEVIEHDIRQEGVGSPTAVAAIASAAPTMVMVDANVNIPMTAVVISLLKANLLQGISPAASDCHHARLLPGLGDLGAIYVQGRRRLLPLLITLLRVQGRSYRRRCHSCRSFRYRSGLRRLTGVYDGRLSNRRRCRSCRRRSWLNRGDHCRCGPLNCRSRRSCRYRRRRSHRPYRYRR